MFDKQWVLAILVVFVLVLIFSGVAISVICMFTLSSSDYDNDYGKPAFEIPSVADQLHALSKEKNFQMADRELRFMAKNMFPGQPTAADETCQEFLNLLGETPGVPCSAYLGFGIVRYCAALRLAKEQPRYCAVAEVFYSTSTSEAPCERVIGDVRAMIGDSRYNLGLKTLSAMLALKNKFETNNLVLRV